MRLAFLLHCIGWIWLAVALTLILPVGIGLVYQEPEWAALAALSFGFSLGGGGLVLGFYWAMIPSERAMLPVFTMCFGIGALSLGAPYLATNVLSYMEDALFEAISGFTTTGFSTIRHPASLPKCMVFWRSLTQWIGGGVFMTASITMLQGWRVIANPLDMQSKMGNAEGGAFSRFFWLLPRFWLVYGLITAAGVGLLIQAKLSPWYALNLALTFISTGGFLPDSTLSNSLSPAIQWVLMGLMLIGASNFALHQRLLLYLKWPRYLHSNEWRCFILSTSIVSAFASWCLYEDFGHTWFNALQHGAFQVVSFATTTGFVSENYGEWSESLQAALLGTALVGGCAGGAAGGFKWLRISICSRSLGLEMMRTFHPNAIVYVKVNGVKLQAQVLNDAFATVWLFLASWLVFTTLIAADGHTLQTALTMAISALSNTGVGFANLAGLPGEVQHSTYLKYVLNGAMLAGRLEILALLTLFTKAAWRI